MKTNVKYLSQHATLARVHVSHGAFQVGAMNLRIARRADGDQRPRRVQGHWLRISGQLAAVAAGQHLCR